MGHSCAKRAWAAVALLALAAVACGSAARTNFYTIQFPVPAPPASPPQATQVGVDLPRASHLLRQDRIVYFTNQNELNFYHHHRWAEPPVFLVQSLLVRQLRGAGLFDNVVPYRAQKGLDYVLRGRLLAMEEVDTANGVTARFGLELELVREKDAQVVWTGRANRERPVAGKNVPALVEAMGGCVQDSLDELTRSLGSAVAEFNPGQGTSP